MSKDSDAFEVKATQFLNDWINPIIPNVSFEREGGKSAYTKDIKVLYDDIEKELFWISAKMSKAQGGQIVVIKNEAGEYKLSDLSHEPVTKNIITQKVINHLNENLPYYEDPDSSGILKDPALITEWFKNQSVIKDERFIIFEDKRKAIHIIPSCYVDDIFKISGKFRPKPSGSRELIKTKMRVSPFYTRKQSIELAIKHLNEFGIEVIGDPEMIEDHTVLNLDKNRDRLKHEKDRYFGDSLFLSIEPPSSFQVRLVIRSKTANDNVITELKLNNKICIPVIGFDLLKNEIEKEIIIRKLRR